MSNNLVPDGTPSYAAFPLDPNSGRLLSQIRIQYAKRQVKIFVLALITLCSFLVCLQRNMAVGIAVTVLTVMTSSFLLLILHDVRGNISNPADASKITSCPSQCICSKDERHVDCSGQQVNNSIIHVISNRTTVLNMSSTNFGRLLNNLFSNLTNLEVLDLFNASLVDIKREAFRGLGNLKYLNISKNENIPITCSTIKPIVFENLTSLIELKMYGTTTANLPQNYPDKALGHLISLEHLWIDGMSNKTFREPLANLIHLKSLRFPGDKVGFGFCDIDTIHNTALENVPTITHLYIVQCGVQVIEENAFVNLTKLEYVDLSGNICLEMDGVSRAFRHVTNAPNLTELVLNHIYYTTDHTCGTVLCEDQISGISKLPIQKLHLDYNAIVQVSKQSIKALPKTLSYLSVKNNEFEPDEYMFYFKDLENLKTLDASYQFFPNMLWFQNEYYQDGFRAQHNVGRNKHTCRNTSKRHVGPNAKIRPVRSLRYQLNERERTRSQFNTVKDLMRLQQSPNTIVICPEPPQKIPPIIPFLPPNLVSFDVSNSKVDFPIYNFSVSSTNSLTTINASKSMLTCWEGPVYGLHKLEYLDLQNNMCERVGPNFFQEFSQLKVLKLGNNLLSFDIKQDVNGILLQNLTQLETLYIDRNRLIEIPPKFLKSQTKLKYIKLTMNQLTSFKVTIGHMKDLSTLDLSYNYISTLSESMRDDLEEIAFSGHNLTVDLSANFIHCYCVNLEFLQWVRKVSNTASLKVLVTNCSYENNLYADISNEKLLDAAIARLKKECASNLPLIIGLTVGIVVFTNIIVGVTVHYYRWKLRYWYYVARVKVKVRSGGYTELQSEMGVANSRWKYDVYVAYVDDEKEEIDFVREMMDYLENKNGMRICDSSRDFVPGQSDYRMISNAIHASRSSIMVITDKSTRDGRWKIAMHMCQEESLYRGKRAHFAIFLGGGPQCIVGNKKLVDLYDLVKANAYLEYPTGSQTNAIVGFWKKCVDKINRCGERYILSED